MDRFRSLIVAALLAGSAAGLVLFMVQHLTIIPLIDQAKMFGKPRTRIRRPAMKTRVGNPRRGCNALA